MCPLTEHVFATYIKSWIVESISTLFTGISNKCDIAIVATLLCCRIIRLCCTTSRFLTVCSGLHSCSAAYTCERVIVYYTVAWFTRKTLRYREITAAPLRCSVKGTHPTAACIFSMNLLTHSGTTADLSGRVKVTAPTCRTRDKL